MKKIKKKLNLPRVPLPRQTGGPHAAEKGGKYRRELEKDRSRKEIKVEDFDNDLHDDLDDDDFVCLTGLSNGPRRRPASLYPWAFFVSKKPGNLNLCLKK